MSIMKEVIEIICRMNQTGRQQAKSIILDMGPISRKNFGFREAKKETIPNACGVLHWIKHYIKKEDVKN